MQFEKIRDRKEEIERLRRASYPFYARERSKRMPDITLPFFVS